VTHLAGHGGGWAARWEDGPRASRRTGCSLSVLYLNRTDWLGSKRYVELGTSGRAPEAGRPGARCVVVDWLNA